MDLGLSEQVAVVIGGASGIGKAIAGAFRTEGAAVALIDRSERVHDAAEEYGGRGWTADVADFAAMVRLELEIRASFKRIDHIVFAAAVGSGKFGLPFWKLDPADWQKVLIVNLCGAVNVAHAFAPGLAEQRSGTILFLGSVAGQTGSQTDPPYSASKAGLINFSQCAARDLAQFGVRVNCLCPGMVKTPLNQAVWQAWNERQPAEARLEYDAWASEKIATLVPLNRWQTPEDIAAMVVFLASERAANVTGQTVNVDGGYVMHS